VQLGRLNAVTNLGQIAGTVTSGFVLAGAGHVPAFLALALLGAVAFAAALRTTEARGKHAEPSASLFASYRPLLERRITYYTLLCAYLSALPFSLSVSFYPLLLEHFGFGERASGILVALRAVGAIGAGLLVGRYVRTGADSLWPVVCGVSVAAAVGLIPLANHFAPIALWMLVVGVGSGAMTLYFQLTISEASRTQERGAALALGGLGWAVSNLTTPLGMGLLADRYGIEAGFYVLGCFALAFTAAAALLRRWAFAGPASAPRARS
jgi:cyanate permease